MAWTTRICMVAVSPLVQRRKTWSWDSDCGGARGEGRSQERGLRGQDSGTPLTQLYTSSPSLLLRMRLT